MTWHAHVMRALASLPVVADEHYLIAQCDHATLAAAMREAGLVADVLIVDAPYSAETHAGHGSMERWGTATPPAYDGANRREIDYAEWSGDDVRQCVDLWSPLVAGWFCSLSDDSLAYEWKASLRSRAGRLAFPLIPCTERGGTVRMSGDGPSSCTTFLAVARPRDRTFLSWGTTPSHYVGPREKKAVIGGKPLWLMRAVVSDYSRPGDLVVDPCMGAGTTLVAAVEQGRRAIGCEPDAGRFEIAARRLAKTRPQLRMRLDCDEVRGEQIGLLGGE